jgi:dinuclear metal center YbgI/SA1388 family protein
MLVADLLAVLEARAPVALAEEWDNVGLLVGRRERPVRRVLVALDLRASVLDEAADAGCDTVLTHHPPIFPALAAVTGEAAPLVLRAAEQRVSVIAAHTNLDSARGGLNDIMASVLGISQTIPLRPADADPGAGLGRAGAVAAGTVGDLARRVADAFPGPVTHTGDPDAPVARVACCTGSGASLIGDAVAAGAEAYVTGDLKYHDADRVPSLGLIDVPHATVEREVMRIWTDGFREALAGDGVEARFARADTDPWRSA